MKKILLIEDDTSLVDLLTKSLGPTYQISCSDTLSKSYDLLEKEVYELVLIDRILPDGDALELVEYIRETTKQTKIIAISQLYQVQEKIKGLELGADDYLPKPFALGELKLKIKNLLSYERKSEISELKLGSLCFYPESGEVLMGEKISKLRKKESAILECLFKYKNRVVSREKIVEEVWSHQDNLPTQTTLDVYIRRIRILLQEYGSKIITKRGFGYMLTEQ